MLKSCIRIVCLLTASLIATHALSQDMSGWSDKTICRLAKTTPNNAEYQVESTKRGLSCGGGAAAVTSSSSNNSSINTNSVELSPIQIMLLQQHLKTEYLYNGAIDGRTSNKLIAALNEIAKKFGLTSNPSLNKEFLTEVLYRYGKIDLRKAVATGWSLDNTFNPVLGFMATPYLSLVNPPQKIDRVRIHQGEGGNGRTGFFINGFRGVGDFNNDGLDDIIHENQFVKIPPHILISQGDGTFLESMEVIGDASIETAGETSIADFNSDGFLDIYFHVNGIFGTNKVRNIGGASGRDLLLMNEGGKRFIAHRIATSKEFQFGVDIHSNHGGHFGDIDGDGDIDVFSLEAHSVVGPDQGINVEKRYLVNDGQGNFTMSEAFLPFTSTISGGRSGTVNSNVRIVDLDNDGIQDIVLSTDADTTPENFIKNGGVHILFGDGNNSFMDDEVVKLTSHWTFENWAEIDRAYGPRNLWHFASTFMDFFDLNDDGYLDVLISQKFSGSGTDAIDGISATGGGFVVYQNEGNRSFREATRDYFPNLLLNHRLGNDSIPDITNFRMQDMDGDGHADFVMEQGEKCPNVTNVYPYIFLWRDGQYLPLPFNAVEDFCQMSGYGSLIPGKFNNDDLPDFVALADVDPSGKVTDKTSASNVGIFTFLNNGTMAVDYGIEILDDPVIIPNIIDVSIVEYDERLKPYFMASSGRLTNMAAQFPINLADGPYNFYFTWSNSMGLDAKKPLKVSIKSNGDIVLRGNSSIVRNYDGAVIGHFDDQKIALFISTKLCENCSFTDVKIEGRVGDGYLASLPDSNKIENIIVLLAPEHIKDKAFFAEEKKLLELEEERAAAVTLKAVEEEAARKAEEEALDKEFAELEAQLEEERAAEVTLKAVEEKAARKAEEEALDKEFAELEAQLEEERAAEAALLAIEKEARRIAEEAVRKAGEEEVAACKVSELNGEYIATWFFANVNNNQEPESMGSERLILNACVGEFEGVKNFQPAKELRKNLQVTYKVNGQITISGHIDLWSVGHSYPTVLKGDINSGVISGVWEEGDLIKIEIIKAGN